MSSAAAARAEDLTAEPTPSIEEIAAAIAQAQEVTRAIIAYWLLLLVTVLVAGGAYATLLSPIGLDRVKQLFDLAFGPLLGLVGTVVGFYFGAKTASER